MGLLQRLSNRNTSTPPAEVPTQPQCDPTEVVRKALLVHAKDTGLQALSPWIANVNMDVFLSESLHALCRTHSEKVFQGMRVWEVPVDYRIGYKEAVLHANLTSVDLWRLEKSSLESAFSDGQRGVCTIPVSTVLIERAILGEQQLGELEARNLRTLVPAELLAFVNNEEWTQEISRLTYGRIFSLKPLDTQYLFVRWKSHEKLTKDLAHQGSEAWLSAGDLIAVTHKWL